MTQRRFHYEQAFEHYLRSNRIPYVAVDEAKKSLMPGNGPPARHRTEAGRSLKSFDFVVYAADRNLLIDVKGRMFGRTGRDTSLCNRRFESWVTSDDVQSLEAWQELFGSGFEATFIFSYCLRQQPPDALFEEVYMYNDRWYALREVTLRDYREAMVPRSPKWKTVHVPGEAFARISRPFSARTLVPSDRACDGS